MRDLFKTVIGTGSFPAERKTPILNRESALALLRAPSIENGGSRPVWKRESEKR
jgi:hypothetical protein